MRAEHNLAGHRVALHLVCGLVAERARHIAALHTIQNVVTVQNIKRVAAGDLWRENK